MNPIKSDLELPLSPSTSHEIGCQADHDHGETSESDLRSPLQLLADVLGEVDFETHLLPPTEDADYEQLLVSLGADTRNRELVMELIFLDDVAAVEETDEDLPQPVILEFMLILPLLVPPEKTLEVTYLAAFINRILPVGAFSFNEGDGLHFRYCLMATDRYLDPTLVVGVLDMAGYFIQHFGVQLEMLAEGYKPLADILLDVEQQGKL